ncbi:MAG TPA: hypothetical protein VJX91_04620 [Candidatus Eisenbacteria bacterium]|nr:hypothetical protein [Candidatus Eisenbacteria bacterium]
MANKKLQFTYFWADEDVMQADFAGKLSQTMTDWAVDFLGRYEFDVDVNPPPSSKPRLLPLSKFALQKNDGIQPDRRPSYERVSALRQRQRQMEEQRDRFREAKEQAAAANNGPEVERLEALLEDTGEKVEAMGDQILAWYDRDENLLRELLMLKFIRDRIVHPERLAVVFCRFRYTSFMTMRRPKGMRGAVGQAFGTIPQELVRLYGSSVVLPLWPDRFVIIDPFQGARKEVVHEAIHAAGHDHPVDDYLKAVEKTYRGRRLPGKGFQRPRDRSESLSGDYDDPVFEFDETPEYDTFRGGFDDGPRDDVMNYAIDDPETWQVNMRPSDVELLKNAFFAK